MNKMRYLSPIALLGLALVSCNNDVVVNKTEEGESIWHTDRIVMNVSMTGFDGATKSAAGWQDGDVVYLLFSDGNSKVQGKAVYKASETAWTVSYNGSLKRDAESEVSIIYLDGSVMESYDDVKFDSSTGIYVDEAGKYTYPTDGDLLVDGNLKPQISRIRFKGEPSLSIKVEGVSHNTSFTFSTWALTSSDSSVTLLVQPDGYTPYFYGSFTDTSNRTLCISHSDAIFSINCTSNVLQTGKSGWMNIPTIDAHNGWTMFVAVKSITIDQTSLTLEKDGSATLTTTVLPVTATDKSVKWSTSDASVASVDDGGVVKYVADGSAVITAASVLNPSAKDSCAVTCIVDKFNGHAYVDLGLTSGTFWATMNVGASKPEDYGDYFAWGETTGYSSGKTYFEWSNYRWCNGSSVTMTKYCARSSFGIVDDKTELELSDDVAHANWGGYWHLPSSVEIDELISECNTEWTTQGDVYGCKVTSKKNGNSIFLPAAGYYNGSSFFSSGSNGNYWSRSLCWDDNSRTYYLHFGSLDFDREDYYRFSGQSARPVVSE